MSDLISNHYDNKYFDWQASIGEFGGWANLTKFAEYISPNSTVLDFGCGGGFLLKNINCSKKVGIEVNPSAIETAKKNGIEVFSRTEDVPDEYVDIIISNNVLEHTLQPLEELKSLYKKLRMGGKIIFVIPCESITYSYKPNDINHHLYTWSPMCIGNLFAEAGFSVIESNPYIHKWPPNYRQIAQEGGREAFEEACRNYGKIETSWFQVRVIAEKKSGENALLKQADLNCQKKQQEATKNLNATSNYEKVVMNSAGLQACPVGADMSGTPVILIVYNRPQHTAKVLESLRRHNIQNLYIFSDAPKTSQHSATVGEVRRLIHDINWCAPVIVERTENFGLAKSIVTAADTVFTQHDRLVLLEDDCVPGPYFFDFVGKCLDKYANHENIFGISGHTVPISREVLDDYPYDLYFSPRIGSWGWATWKRAWQFYDRDIKRLAKAALAGNIDWNQGGNDWPVMFSRFLRGEIKDVWTMNWVLSVYNNNGSYIFPTKSHITNIGTDGSGEHCGTTNMYDSKLSNTEPKRFPEKCFYDRHIIPEFWKRFDSKPRKSNPLPICGNAPDRLTVAQINTLDFAGGAAKVAWTLKESLKEKGHISQMFVGKKDSDATDVCLITDQDTKNAAEIGKKTGLLYYDIKSTFKLASNPAFTGCDIFHFHNLHGDYFNLFALPELTKIKPCVWTLHDMQSLTGHCAHSFGCERWKTGCGNCQHLDIDPMVLRDQTAQVWKDKQRIYSESDITVVVPSNWLKTKVEQGLLKDKRVELVYNGIDTRIFKPGDKIKARQKLGLPLDGTILAFTAHGGMDGRWRDGKGLAQAISYLSTKHKDVFFLNIGHNSNRFAVPNTINVPYVTDQRMLACIYAAADMFLFPSLADNCPLSVIEAMACGLPVISYKIGGIPELVCDGKTGILAEYKNVPQFTAATELLIADKQKRYEMSIASVNRVREKFTLERMVESYLEIYQELRKRVKVIEVGNLNKGEHPLVQLSSRSLSKTDCRVFAYSKKSHFVLFKGYDTELYAGAVDPDNCDLKNYQDLLVLLFIRENIPKGSRILDIGGGDSRILKHLKDEYECWNLDKLQGRGSGPASIDSTGYRLVKDYIGNFNKELPDNYFDFVFSISALEHAPDDNQDYLGNIRDDIERILKPGGYSLHCFDVVIKKDSVWTNKLLPFFCQNLKMITPFVPFEELERDPDLYVMTEKSYQKRWQHLTGKSYGEFGKPLSYNVLWQKMPSPLIKTSGIIGRFDKANVPKISVVTPSFNQAEYLEECIDSILGQNYPNLEYIIMDGASTDGSVEIIKKYEKYLSYWQSRPDGGQYAAINEGFKRATGEIMTWLNSDDKYHTDSLFKAAHVFGKYPDIEWITGRPTAWNEKGRLILVSDELPLWSREKYLNRTFKDHYIQQESTFWKKTLWDKAGGTLELHLQFAGDLELWVRFFRHARLFTVDALLGGYRYQCKQKTNLCMDKYIQEGNQIIDQELADIKKGKFTMMLPAPKPVSFNKMEFQEHKRKIVSADIPDSRREYGLQPQKGTALTVATSIAPGQLAKQVNAIESWIKLGFDVVSINGKEEIETLKGAFPNVRFIQAKRDAKNILGRPFVYFDDILEYLKQTDSEICGIVNSDIYLSGDENVVSFIRSQAKNSLVYGARTEVDSLENLSGTVYQKGFDFFFFDKSLISHFPKSDFCIGATWWDYWMPVILVLAGCPVKKLVSPFAYHVSHPCKWDEKQWFLMGGKFYGYLREIICEKIASKSLTGNWDLLARMLSTYAHFFIKKAGSVQNKDEHAKILYQSGGPCILEFLGIESQPIDQTGRQSAKSSNADDYADSDITVGIPFEDYQKAGELNQYGEYLLNKGDTEGAMKAFTEATRILPDFTAAYSNIGVSYLRKDQPAAALKYFTKALKIDPVYLPAVINSAGVLIHCGKIQTARNLVLNSAKKLIDSGRPGKAAEIYRAYLQENPSDGGIIRALENLGIIESAEAGEEIAAGTMPSLQPQTVDPQSKYLVTAIISAYNSERFMRGCLDDLERQTIADRLEIIVVNSGSQQNEDVIIKEFQQRYDNIVYIKTEHREGIYSAWNRAVKAARGQFLTNANTDDRHSKDAYEIMVKTFLDNPDVALVYGDQIKTDAPNDTFENNYGVEKLQRPEYSHERLLFGCCVGSQPMWRKSLHGELGLFDESLTCAGDWDFWLRISKKYKFKRIPQFLGLYYYNENGVEHGTKIHSLYERYIVGKRYGNPYISVIPIYKNNQNSLVSIIMPAYNAGKFIARAVESALIQNYRNFEIVVVDDGSTDNTKEILQKFNDPGIRYIALEKNQGVSHARNVAVQQARGEFIVSLDADDMLMPDFISRHLIEFEKHPDADMVYCDDLLIDENDKPIREIKRQNYRNRKSLIGDLFRYGFPIVHCRHFVRRNIFDRIGLYDESLIIGEDYDLMRKFVKEGLKFYHLPENLCLRRIVDSSLSRKFSAEKAKSHFDVVKRYSDTFACEELFPDVDWSKVAPEKRKLQAKCLSAVTCFTIGQSYAKTAPVYAKTAFDQACSELDECFRMDPANPHVQQLLRKCEAVRTQCEQAVQEAVY